LLLLQNQHLLSMHQLIFYFLVSFSSPFLLSVLKTFTANA
jgi:hypothetical protein